MEEHESKYDALTERVYDAPSKMTTLKKHEGSNSTGGVPNVTLFIRKEWESVSAMEWWAVRDAVGKLEAGESVQLEGKLHGENFIAVINKRLNGAEWVCGGIYIVVGKFRFVSHLYTKTPITSFFVRGKVYANIGEFQFETAMRPEEVIE